MSSNLETGKAAGDKATVISTVKNGGNLIDEVACSSAEVLAEHLLRCNREGRRNFPGRPCRLPANPAQRVDFFLTLAGADAIIEHSISDLVISVEAGISLSSLRSLLAEKKQWFPVCVPDESISLMEYINSGSSGPLEHGYGEARDLVLGMRVALGAGELINCGGKVVKNVTGYDLPKLFAGSHGTLCVPFSAHLRLFALPETSSTLVFHFKSNSIAIKSANVLRRSGLPVSALEIVSGELFRLLDPSRRPAGFASLARGEILLCVQLHGSKSVVAELEKELVRLMSDACWAQNKLDLAQEEQLWKFLSRPYEFLSAQWLEICGTISLLEKSLAEMNKIHNAGAGVEDDCIMGWTLRPGRNKGLIVVGNAPVQSSAAPPSSPDASADLQQIKTDLASCVARLSGKMTVSYADNNFLWKVSALPAEDAVLNELKHRIRREYDPQGVLNPLAAL